MPISTKNYAVKRTLADGSTKVYQYKRGPAKPKKPARQTVAWVIAEYRASPDFTKKAYETRRLYSRILEHLTPLYDVDVAAVTRAHVLKIRDRLSERPGSANLFVKVASIVLKFALDRGYRTDFNPARDISGLGLQEHGPWPDEAIDLFLAKAPSHLRLGFLLALHTGQRLGDVVALRWSDWDGSGFTVKQQKTGVEVYVPATPELLQAITEAKRTRRALTIVETQDGRPYKVGGFAGVFRKFCRQIGIAGVRFHDLRHTAATRLAEAGCTPHEIMSITGHQSLSVVERYTRKARQKHLAAKAIERLGGDAVRNDAKRTVIDWNTKKTV